MAVASLSSVVQVRSTSQILSKSKSDGYALADTVDVPPKQVHVPQPHPTLFVTSPDMYNKSKAAPKSGPIGIDDEAKQRHIWKNKVVLDDDGRLAPPRPLMKHLRSASAHHLRSSTTHHSSDDYS